MGVIQPSGHTDAKELVTAIEQANKKDQEKRDEKKRKCRNRILLLLALLPLGAIGLKKLGPVIADMYPEISVGFAEETTAVLE